MPCIYSVGRYPAAAWWSLARQTGQNRLVLDGSDCPGYIIPSKHLNASLTTTFNNRNPILAKLATKLVPANTPQHLKHVFLSWLLCPDFFVFLLFFRLFLHGSLLLFVPSLVPWVCLFYLRSLGWAVHTMKALFGATVGGEGCHVLG